VRPETLKTMLAGAQRLDTLVELLQYRLEMGQCLKGYIPPPPPKESVSGESNAPPVVGTNRS
jgi:hypothetical protein